MPEQLLEATLVFPDALAPTNTEKNRRKALVEFIESTYPNALISTLAADGTTIPPKPQIPTYCDVPK